MRITVASNSPAIFFAPERNPVIMTQICSVLAGYVWDTANPYVAQADRALPLLAKVIQRTSRS